MSCSQTRPANVATNSCLYFISFYQGTPWQDAKELPAEVDRPWERREVIAPVTDTAPPPASAAAVTRRNNLPTSSASRSPDRRKSAPAQPRWNSQG